MALQPRAQHIDSQGALPWYLDLDPNLNLANESNIITIVGHHRYHVCLLTCLSPRKNTGIKILSRPLPINNETIPM